MGMRQREGKRTGERKGREGKGRERSGREEGKLGEVCPEFLTLKVGNPKLPSCHGNQIWEKMSQN